MLFTTSGACTEFESNPPIWTVRPAQRPIAFHAIVLFTMWIL